MSTFFRTRHRKGRVGEWEKGRKKDARRRTQDAGRRTQGKPEDGRPKTEDGRPKAYLRGSPPALSTEAA